MKKIIFFILIFSFCLIASAATDRVVAVVNDEVITQSEADAFFKALSVELSSQYKGKALEQEQQKLKTEILDRLIEDRLIQQEAKSKGIQIKKDEITSRINQLKRDFNSEEEFYATLQEQGLTLGEVEKKIAEQLLAYRLIDREVRQKTEVKPTEVTAFYQGHLEEFKEAEKRVVDSIFVEKKEEAEKIITFLKNGDDFLNLKEKYSQRDSLGEVAKGQLRPEIEDPIFALKEGEYSDIVKSEGGFYIFKLSKIIPERTKELFEVQATIHNYLFEQKMQKKMVEWLDNLKAKAHIVVK